MSSIFESRFVIILNFLNCSRAVGTRSGYLY